MPEEEKVTPTDASIQVMRTAYPPNTNKAKAAAEKPEKKIESVVEGEVTKKKPSVGQRLKASFTGDDAKNVFEYLIFDVALPALKTTVSDMVSQGIERLLFGDRARVPGPGNRRPGRVDYNVISRGATNRDVGAQRALSSQEKATHNFDNIVFQNRSDAEKVLSGLADLIEQYDMATVSDFYELTAITGSFADDKWGWFDLRGADITRVRDGWVLDLPRTQPIR
jgi:hypothetical protein